MLKSLGLWKLKGSSSGSSSYDSSVTGREEIMHDKFDERLEERYDEKSSTSSSTSSSSPSLVPASSKKQDDEESTSTDESSIVSQIQDSSKRSHHSKHSSSLSRDSSVVSTIRGSIISQRLDSSETLKECTPLSYPRDTSMLLETAELFHSWEESPNEDSDDDEKTAIPRAPGSISRYQIFSTDQKRLANFSSTSFQNTSSGSVPLPFNGWQSSCDTTAHERQLSDLSKLSNLQSLGDDGVSPGESRKASIASHCVIHIGGPVSRQSSLVLHPHHRRQFSGGSRVSFHEVVQCEGGAAIGAHLSQYLATSQVRSLSALSAAELSESIHITCQRCNMEALKNMRKPDMKDIERVKESLRKVPPLAKDG